MKITVIIYTGKGNFLGGKIHCYMLTLPFVEFQSHFGTFLARLSIIQQLSTNQHERLAVETPRGERIEIRALYSTRHREQQSVQPQLLLFQHCSIQAKMQKISCKHGYIGYTDMLPTCQFLLWCSLIPTQAPHFLMEQFLLSPKVEVTPPHPPILTWEYS